MLLLRLVLHVLRQAENELILAADGGEYGRRPRAGRLVLLPHGLPGPLVHREEVVAALLLVRPAPQDRQVAVQHRRRPAAERVVPLPEVGALPEFFAVEVVAVHPGRREAHHHSLAVGRRRGVGVPVLVPVPLLLGVRHVLLPADAPVGAGQAEEAPLRPALVPLREEDAVLPHDRRGVPRVGERHLPLHVVLRRPRERNGLLVAQPLPGRPAPGGPVGGEGGARGGQDGEGGSGA